MTTGRINKTTVDALVVAQGETFLWDKDLHGFGLKATAAGAKSYLIQYRIGGRGSKVRRLTIGRHGSLLSDQREDTDGEMAGFRHIRHYELNPAVLQLEQEGGIAAEPVELGDNEGRAGHLGMVQRLKEFRSAIAAPALDLCVVR